LENFTHFFLARRNTILQIFCLHIMYQKIEFELGNSIKFFHVLLPVGILQEEEGSINLILYTCSAPL
jgi:hypothetical protein